MSSFFDFTPDPKILIALTHTPMLPLDSLCELIDNAIDSFSAAKIQGITIERPLIEIELPSRSEISNNTGFLRVADNGLGMTHEMAENAIRAGFSGNNPYDNLGLFGMGFNISTGKIGRITRFRTARKENELCIDTKIDLEAINNSKDYRLPVTDTAKPEGFTNGTIIEISNWWPEGNPNKGFILKLVHYGIQKIREEIGRRYATILRKRDILIIINSEKCEPFEHCVWGDNRFVEHRKYGKIPAVFKFDKILGNKIRCGKCTAIIPQGETKCPSCGSSSIRTIEERVNGWIGIQRFDDAEGFGIDLIRNGRAIRIAEKSAFFEFVDDLKHVTKDYPIDSQYGRIIGEVSLDFVPVDFLKQDFQRSSDEWQRAMKFLRGESSLQPTKPGADDNDSIVYKLYQGYRRVRNFGKADLYMGYWDIESKSTKRISRDIEKEYYEKFKQKIIGFYDDAEWWKRVEEADEKPLETLIDCPSCSSQNLKESDVCTICGHILKSKQCISNECGETIPLTAQVCPKCGISQIPQIQTPWTCDVCSTRNRPEVNICEKCARPKGTPNPLTSEYLLTVSNKSDELSLNDLSIKLADGTSSTPININVYITFEPITSINDDEGLPIITIKNIGEIIVFIDKMHRIFRTCNIRPEELIAAEVAMFIYDTNRALSSYKEHNLSSITWKIISKSWIDTMEENPERIKTEIKTFFEHIKNRLIEIFGAEAENLLDEMSNSQKKSLANNIISLNGDLSKFDEMQKSGNYLRFIPDNFILNIFSKRPEKLFNGGIWDVSYDSKSVPILTEEMTKYVWQKIKKSYESCLEDLIMFMTNDTIEKLILQRVKLSLNFLQRKLVI